MSAADKIFKLMNEIAKKLRASSLPMKNQQKFSELPPLNRVAAPKIEKNDNVMPFKVFGKGSTLVPNCWKDEASFPEKSVPREHLYLIHRQQEVSTILVPLGSYQVPKGIKAVWDLLEKVDTKLRKIHDYSNPYLSLYKLAEGTFPGIAESMYYETQLEVERIVEDRLVHHKLVRRHPETKEFYEQIRDVSVAKSQIDKLKETINGKMSNFHLAPRGVGVSSFVFNNKKVSVDQGVVAIWNLIKRAEDHKITYAEAKAKIDQVMIKRLQKANELQFATKKFFEEELNKSKELRALREIRMAIEEPKNEELKKLSDPKSDKPLKSENSQNEQLGKKKQELVPKAMISMLKLIDQAEQGKISPAEALKEIYKIVDKRHAEFMRMLTEAKQSHESLSSAYGKEMEFFKEIYCRAIGSLQPLLVQRPISVVSSYR